MTSSTPAAESRPPAAIAPPPTHACVRCGATVDIATALCEDCNPLGLSQPASTQVHAIALGGVAVGVLALFVIARLSVSGIGPFDGKVVDVQGRSDGLAITLTVANHGSNTGQGTCRVTDPAARFGGASAFVLTPRIDPGSSLTFGADIRELGTNPRLLITECTGP